MPNWVYRNPLQIPQQQKLPDVGQVVDPQLVLSGYIFRKDDGTEITATQIAAQNNDISVQVGNTVRLRIQTDNLADPNTIGFKLEYRPVGAVAWRGITT